MLQQEYDATVSDGHGGTVTQTVSVTLTGANDAPSWRPWVRRLSPSTTT